MVESGSSRAYDDKFPVSCFLHLSADPDLNLLRGRYTKGSWRVVDGNVSVAFVKSQYYYLSKVRPLESFGQPPHPQTGGDGRQLECTNGDGACARR